MKVCKRHIRCPHCQSLETQRKGKNLINGAEHKRWYCNQCKHSFSPVTTIKQTKAAKCYFEEQEAQGTPSAWMGNTSGNESSISDGHAKPRIRSVSSYNPTGTAISWLIAIPSLSDHTKRNCCFRGMSTAKTFRTQA